MEKRVKRVRVAPTRTVFVDGFAEGWAFAVPVAFKQALDVLVTPRKVGGQTKYVETEGVPGAYSFEAGDIFYDTKDAYDVRWNELLGRVSIALQVQAGTPDQLSGDRIRTGTVIVHLLRPNPARTRLDVVERRQMTQSEFVETLRSGKLV